MKLAVTVGATIGGLVGGWLGGMLDHGNMLGGWSLLLSTIGGIAGIIIAYKIAKNYAD